MSCPRYRRWSLLLPIGLAAVVGLSATARAGELRPGDVDRAVRRACGDSGLVRAGRTGGPSRRRPERGPRLLPPFLGDLGRLPVASHLAAGAVVGGGVALGLLADHAQTGTVGDVIQVGLPTGGLVLAVRGDGARGRLQWAATMATAMGTTRLLKAVIHERRPRGNSPDAFPSGHATVAFAGAAFVERRYGASHGVPAYLLAGLAAFARVRGQRHDLADVVAGASIGMLSAWLFTEPRDVRCGEHRRGRRPRARYVFETGPFWQAENEAQAPPTVGDLVRFETRDAGHPPWRARASYEWEVTPDGRHQLSLVLAPIEVRDTYVPGSSLRFGEATFVPGERVFTRFLAHEYSVRYLHRWLTRGRLRVEVGAALVLTHCEVRVRSPSRQGATSGLWLRPRPHARATYDLGRSLRLVFEAEGWPLGEHRVLSALVLLRWEVSETWDLGIGHRLTLGRTQGPDIDHEFLWHGIVLQFGHTF